MQIPLLDPTPKAQFSMFEMGDSTALSLLPLPIPSSLLFHFDSLSGGEQNITTITYPTIDEQGNVVTRSMPGPATYAPVVIRRPIDVAAVAIYQKFVDAVEGKLKTLRKNYSISMNGWHGLPILWWHLYGVIPIKVGGIAFDNSDQAAYASFELTLQCERIEMDLKMLRK